MCVSFFASFSLCSQEGSTINYMRCCALHRQSSTVVASYERFWAWCAASNITSKQLSIKSVGGVCNRGLFLDEPVKSGAVLASIPYKACINRELLGTSSRLLPPSPMLGKALKKAGLSPFGTEHLWLAAYMATLSLQGDQSNTMSPFLNILPNMTSLDLQRKSATEALTPTERQEVADIEESTRRHVSLTSKFAKRFATLQRRRRQSSAPRCSKREFNDFMSLLSEATIAQSHDLVMSRSVALPWGCRASTPRDLTTFLDEELDVQTLPTLVPLLDLVNSSMPTDDSRSNCDVYTCTSSQFVHEGTRRTRKVVSTPASRLGRMRVVLCASRDIAAGEELLMDYNVDDVPAAAYRFGFAPNAKAK